MNLDNIEMPRTVKDAADEQARILNISPEFVRDAYMMVYRLGYWDGAMWMIRQKEAQ